MSGYDERQDLEQALDSALDTIDDMSKEIGGAILSIARNNGGSGCACCLETAGKLFSVMKDYSEESDVTDIRELWNHITETNIDDL